MIKKIPGGYVGLLVGGAVVLYLLGNADVSPSVSKLADDTVGAGTKAAPGGLLGLLGILTAAGVFLNEHAFGKVA